MKKAGLYRFWSYLGGKHANAHIYPKPIHDKVIEPFAGSAGYACLHWTKQIYLYDLSPIVFGIWDYLIHHAKESEIRSLPDRIECTDDLKCCQELKWLVGFNINSCRETPVTEICEPRNKWRANFKYQIARQLKHIRHWKVFLRDYQDIPNRLATWHVDPPYQGRLARSYPVNKVKGQEIDFEFLGDWCVTRRGQVMVCENTTATWLPFRPLKVINAQTGKGKKGYSCEAIWTKNDGDNKRGFGLSSRSM